MHRSGNYRAAINAYTKAVEIDASLSVCYANRAASHLKMQEYRQAACTYFAKILALQVRQVVGHLGFVSCYMGTWR